MAKNYEAVTVKGIVIGDVEHIKFNDKTKTVFNVKDEHGTVKQCVSWRNENLQDGKKVRLTGRKQEGAFIVWSMMHSDNDF